jgi:MacB-like periplasmic core domain/FtsX-like permease family
MYQGEVAVRAVVMVLRARSRQYWKSWLALSVLVAVAGGFVLSAAVTARRTAAAFPGFTARHGYDVIVYSEQPRPQLTRLPHVASLALVPAAYVGTLACASCRNPIDANDLLINEVPPRQLPRMVKLLSGRMPDQSDPREVLASFTLAQDNGVRVGSVIRAQLGSPAQLRGGPADPSPVLHPVLRVVGIVAAESEFPSGAALHYDLYATTAFAAAVNRRAALLSTYYLRFAHGPADLAGSDSRFRSLGADGTYDLDAAAGAVEGSIRPQVIGWYVLASLAALAALAVIGQAIARQAATERADHPALSAIGLRPRELVLVTLARAALIGAAGAAGAIAVAVLASPLTPVGEARIAVSSPGRMSFDPVALPLGALAVLAAVTALSVWPAVRYARLLPARPQRPAATVAMAAGRAATMARLPATALIGIRAALERGRGGQPVGTALLGMVLAVAALCATAVFGASLTHLVSSPALYGAPFQAYFGGNGDPGSEARVTGPLLDSLRKDQAIERITLGAFVEVNVNGRHVRTVVMTPVRGRALLSALDGRLPRGDRDIMLGVATMRATGARVGGTVRVTVADPSGVPHEARFRVIGRASLNAGTGGLGDGAVMTTSAFIRAQCPAGRGQAACQGTVRHGMATVVLVRAARGAAGSAALARYIRQYRSLTYRPAKPTVLVNFGESVNFPLLFGMALSLFGAATLVHLLLVSVARRRRETGLLKVLGFVRGQVAAAVCWQATTVALAGIVVGAPIGIAAGRVLWRVFATNFGVIPVPVVPPLLVVALAAGVLVAANVLAAVPALLAARSHPDQLLRAE